MTRLQRPPNAEHVAEMRRRAEQRFQTARAAIGSGNMNNAKWRDVLELLGRHRLTIKFLDEAQPRVVHALSAGGDNWVDSTCGPFEFRQIEWLEYHGTEAAEVMTGLSPVGRLPLVAIPGGFRLQAYGTLQPVPAPNE